MIARLSFAFEVFSTKQKIGRGKFLEPLIGYILTLFCSDIVLNLLYHGHIHYAVGVISLIEAPRSKQWGMRSLLRFNLSFEH